MERRPLAIVGLHHYQLNLGPTCCFAVPIADDGNILGSMELRIATEDSTLERVGTFLARALALLKA
jgi:transcriptional regulator of acetoin/glycerol metabolism